ncbi:MAG: hypothetical protein JKX76_03570 [Colwellia sp.]|nr:hypothetical protein [Colwellia sp.]
MKVEAKGSNEKTITHIAVSGFFVNRWTLLRILKKMHGVSIKDKAIIRNYIKDKPLIAFEYKGTDFIVEPEYFSGNEFEIRHIEAEPVKELLAIKEHLLSL